MQFGFVAYEVGLARRQHAAGVALKNLLDWGVTITAFSMVGVALMLGASSDGLFGTTGFGMAVDALPNTTALDTTLVVLFQLGFAGTAVTIVSGALVERVTLLTYAVISVIGAALIYPIVAHWVWGGVMSGESGWLEAMGYRDFAGASVVHVVGAAIALVGALFVGPRVGRFDADGKPVQLPGSSIATSALGVVVLWVGWWGFNGGSAVFNGASVGHVIVVTNLAGAGGLLAALMLSLRALHVIHPPGAAMGGALAGLVAVTAVADTISPGLALLLGVMAGAVFIAATELLQRLRIDDALMAVPIHGAAGALGIVVGPCLASTGNAHAVWEQLGVQLTGLLAIVAWSIVVAVLSFGLLKRFTGLRIAPSREVLGTDGWREGAPTRPDDGQDWEHYL